ncbi:MAG: hypothetical protein V4616_07845 [Bacteroidota bacterium]
MKKPLLLSLAALTMLGSLISGCKKDKDEPIVATPAPTLIDMNYRLTGTFGTDSVNMVVAGAQGASIQHGSNDRVINADTSSRTYQMSMSSNTGREQLIIEKGTLEFLKASGLPASTVMTYFRKGSYPYLSPGSDDYSDGIAMTFVDKSGEIWRSNDGFQSTGTFTITDVVSKSEFSKPGAKIKAEINATFYSPDGTRTKQMNTEIITIFIDPR